jgi:hypothetical protein
MSSHRLSAVRIAAAIVTCSSLFAATSASAGPVACVQRAIDWNNADPHNYVTYAVSALHESGEAAYAAGSLRSSICPRELWAGTISCLVSVTARDALLLHPYRLYAPAQTLNNLDFLRLSFDLIPGENEQEVHLRQPHATYDFYPRCVGNMVTGNDQYGNHWTIALMLAHITPP